MLLAEGKFHEGDTITTGAVSSPLSLTETVVEAWILTIPVGGGPVDHTIRWLMPDPNGHYAVYLLQGGNWVRIKAESLGSYRCFPIVGGGTIAITESPGLPGWGWAAGAGTLADPAKSAMMLNKYKNEAAMKVATETPYQDSLDLLKY